MRVMQGSGSAALIPVPPRNCRHLGTCFKYMSSPSYCTGLSRKHPTEAESAALVSLVRCLGSPSSRSINLAVTYPCLMYFSTFPAFVKDL